MSTVRIPIEFVGTLVDQSKQEAKPFYATPGSVGLDLKAAIPEAFALAPSQRILVKTGIAMHLPVGYEGQIRSRSGLALKHGVHVLNSPGTIDQDYRGEVGVVLVNHGHEVFEIEPFMRIAQLVIAPVVRASLEVVSEFTSGDSIKNMRQQGGFGSTGV